MSGWKQRLAGLVIGSLIGGLGLPGLAQAQSGDVVVFAAASLKNALDAIAGGWQQETGNKSKISYAAASTLAKQLEQGAPADLFISADLEWMDYVDQRKLIRPGSRINLLGNKLVLIGPKDGAKPITIAPGFDLLTPLAGGRLAMGAVASVPVGKYGKAALENLGVWESLKGRIAEAETVRVALTYVARGETPLGIVYQTDAAADQSVAVLGTFPAGSHPDIVYPAAVMAESKRETASALFRYLQGPQAKAQFEAQGFTVLVKTP